jgi:long-chain acyl-CoA synthetase
MSHNLAQNLAEAVATHGRRPAVRLDDVELDYATLDAAAARIAGVLRARGVGAGDRVGVMLPNVPYFPAVYYGALRLGAIVVPMNVLLKEREVAFYLADSGAKVLFAWHGFAEAAEAGARQAGAGAILVEPGRFEEAVMAAEPVEAVGDRAAGDTAVILYTSGTTGSPKGAELTHANLGSNVGTVVELFSLAPGDVLFGGLPLFHSFGQTCAMNAAVRAGALLTLIARFDAGKALEILQRDRATVFEGVPTMYVAMLAHEDRGSVDLSSLRLCVSGGASLPVEVLRGFEQAFDCKVLEGYGLSETSPVASFNHPDRERKPGSIGTPLRGVRMKVVDGEDRELAPGEVGEIVVQGPNVMKGYWQRPDATAEAVRGGWLHTGDMARVDEDGYFFIVDRKKELIIRGGYNVYPREVEEVLYEHPAVREAAVIGMPHDGLGEEVGAAVVLDEPGAVGEDELRDYVKERLAAYKYPRRIWFVGELPKGPTGKILKREIEAP